MKQIQIRRAIPRDAARVNELLYQVAALHAEGRPDIFKHATKKYSDEELTRIMACDTTPIFVATDDSGYVWGYAFCIFRYQEGSMLLEDKKTLYIDDICVDERARGMHIGKRLYEHVASFARERGFDNLTLNVWAFNTGAYRFYEACGMTPQRIIMEKTL